MSNTDRLAYKDRYVRSYVGDITEDTSQDTVFNELGLPPSEKSFLALSVTGDEYVQMFSSLLAGSELINPDDAQQILWLLWKAAKNMTFCETVAGCITGGDLDETLEDWLGDNGYGGNPDVPLSPEIMDADMLDGLCTNDEIWGACITVINGVFDTTLEVLQRISLATEPLEAIGEVTELLGPVGKILGIAVTLIDWISDTALALFETADSAVVREDLACELFCLVKEDCTFTMTKVLYVFESNAVDTPPFFNGLKSQLEWLFGLIIAGNPNVQVAATINLLGVYTMQYGGAVGEWLLSVRSLQQLAALGAANEASNDWSILCDVCPVCTPYDFSLGELSWVGAIFPTFTPRAVYNTDKWGANPSGLRGQLLIEFAYTGNLTSVTINLDSLFEEKPAAGSTWWMQIDANTAKTSATFGVNTLTFNFPQEAVVTEVKCGVLWHSVSGGGEPLCPNEIISVVLCD